MELRSVSKASDSPGEEDKLTQLTHRSSKLSEIQEETYEEDPPDADSRKSVLTGTAGYIIVTEFCERLTYYGFAGSLILFFQTRMGMTNAQADVQYASWSGVCYIMPLIGGYVADTWWGRYKTILVFCIIYLIGLALVVIAAIPGNSSAALVFSSIYIIAVGTGGIKPNVCTLGADQFDEKYSKDRKEKESFFNWFYWSINLAALISYIFVADICQNGIPSLGGENWGFFLGYMIPCVAMTIGIIIYVSGHSKYVVYPPRGSILGDSASIVYEALWTRRNVSLDSLKPDGNPDRKPDEVENPPVALLDRANKENGGSFTAMQVHGVKLVTRLTPYLIAFIPYWGLYSQMSTAFQNQGCQMNLDMAGGIQVPISALNVFDCFAVLLFVPVFDAYIYPGLKAKGFGVTMLRKIGIGFVFALLAMLMAAIIEVWRIDSAPTPGKYDDISARNNITPCQSIDDYNPYNYQEWYSGIDDTDQPAYCHQVCDTTYETGGVVYLNMTCIDCDDIPQMSSISIFWQIPQFALVGISEILASVTSLEFFYSQAPLPMRSVSQSLNMLTNAMGSLLTIPLLYIVNSNPNDEWVTSNLDSGHLDYYFLLLAALMLLNIFYFIYVAGHYEYKTTEQLTLPEEDEAHDSNQDHDQTVNGVRDGLLANQNQNQDVTNNPMNNDA